MQTEVDVAKLTTEIGRMLKAFLVDKTHTRLTSGVELTESPVIIKMFWVNKTLRIDLV